MIVLKLTNQFGLSSEVFFNDSEDIHDPSSPTFANDALLFPYDDIPNEEGHMPAGNMETPDDFTFKAFSFGLNVEVISDGL